MINSNSINKQSNKCNSCSKSPSNEEELFEDYQVFCPICNFRSRCYFLLADAERASIKHDIDFHKNHETAKVVKVICR